MGSGGLQPDKATTVGLIRGWQAELEPREAELQKVSLEALGEECEQLLVVSEEEEVASTPPPNSGMRRAERRQV